jgi:hypothetical protein
MTGKASHPGIELLDYLSGRFDSNTALGIEKHIAQCSACSSLVGLVRQLKASRAAGVTISSESHPDVGELARFFYSKSAKSRHPATAAHIAVCAECAAEIAEYARAESIASKFQPSQHTAGDVPASAWRLIHDWEDSDFALPKETGLSLGPDLLEKLYKLLETAEIPSAELSSQDSVPVMVVDRRGELKRVETFERVRDERGSIAYRQSGRTELYDKKPVHVLVDVGQSSPLVISQMFERGLLKLEQPIDRGDVRRADFFIVED